MSQDRVVGAVEIGTSKVAVLIGEIVGNGGLNIIGHIACSSKGVKKGQIADLNASFDPHNLNSVQGRNLNETLKINVKDEAVKSGEFVKLEFSTSAFIQGFQFTLDFNSDVLNFKGIEEGILTGANLGSSNNEEGIITFSWNDSKPVDFNGEELISIEFYALQDIQLS